MAPSPAMEESHRGIRSTHSVGRIVRLISALALVLFASLGATKATATPQDPPLGPACHGVQVAPGDDLQRLIDSHHRRSTFCFASGVYQLSGTVWTGSKFPRLDLRAGAVIDGQNGAFVGINGAGRASGPAGNGHPGRRLPALRQRERPELGVAGHRRIATGWSWGTEFKDNFNAGLAIQGDDARVSRRQHPPQRQIRVGRHRSACIGCPARRA